MKDGGAQAGFGLIEIMVVLALLAGLSVVALSSIARDPDVPRDLLRFIAERRAEAIRSGRPVAIEVAQDDVRSALSTARWSGLLLSGNEPIRLPYSFVVFSDGSYSGPPFSLSISGVDRPLSGVFRGPPA